MIPKGWIRILQGVDLNPISNMFKKCHKEGQIRIPILVRFFKDMDLNPLKIGLESKF